MEEFSSTTAEAYNPTSKRKLKPNELKEGGLSDDPKQVSSIRYWKTSRSKENKRP
jgi:hypothetical protein